MSSDAHHFVETLQSIGYKPAKQLTPSLVEWMFDTRTTPFLVWFSNSVSQSNVLRPEEITEFSKLEEDGVRILEADQVEKILNFSDLFNDDSELESQEILRNKMYEFKENKKLLQERKEALLKRRHLLSARLASLKNNFFRAENSQKNGEQSYHESEQKAQVANNSTSASNGRLKESVNLINGLYEESGSPDLEPQDDAVFLSQVNLKHLQKLEDRFIQEVTNYCKKQFFEGIANMAGHDKESQYCLMEIDDHETMQLQGENLQPYLVYSQEFTRLKRVYPDIENFRIMSCVELSFQKSILDEARAIRKDVQGLHWREYKSILSSQLQENQSSIQLSRQELLHQTEEVMPRLIKQSTESHVLPIITGDYNLKLARQDYFSAKQDQVIKYLVVQRSRNEFLSMAYDVENKNHRCVHRLLQALHAQLSAQEQCRQERMALMKETRLDPAKHQRATIDCRDTSLLRLHSVLAYKPEDEKKLFQKLSNLVDGANKLYLKLSSSQSASKNLYSRHEQIRRLKLLLNKCDGAMYWQSTRTTAHPQLTPYPIKKAHRKLGNLLDQLGIILKDIIGGADQKKQDSQYYGGRKPVTRWGKPTTIRMELADLQKECIWQKTERINVNCLCIQILKCCPDKRAERGLYEFFLLSPDRLHILFDKLGERLQAKKTR